jgi:uncharacterized protein YjbI with pentapeptide repeats
VPERYIVGQDTGMGGTRDLDFDDVDVLVLDDDGEAAAVRVVGGRQPGASFALARLHRVEFVRCDLTGCDFSEASLRDVRFVDCRAGAIELGQVTMRDVAVVDSLFGGANLRLSKLTGVTFARSLLARAEFNAAHLERVAFGECDLTGADFTHARCVDVDLRGARLDDLCGIASLGGSKITPDQLFGLAPGLAAAVGITVVDEEDPPIRSGS